MVRTRFCLWMAIAWLMAAAPGFAAVLEEGSVTVTPASIVVGFREGVPSGDGTLRITPPSALTSGSLSVARGLPGGHMGRVFVEGGALNITSGGNIGETGIGRLEVTDGGIADFGKDLLVGGVNTSTLLAEGTIVVEGLGSRMRTGTRMIVGEYGLGEMYLANGAVVSPL
ncbi:MAG: hypothetical protein H0T51_06520 [Pirellulales bacterium]|nr:hypothetical protein [Pirellulales bacterium]